MKKEYMIILNAISHNLKNPVGLNIINDQTFHLFNGFFNIKSYDK